MLRLPSPTAVDAALDTRDRSLRALLRVQNRITNLERRRADLVERFQKTAPGSRREKYREGLKRTHREMVRLKRDVLPVEMARYDGAHAVARAEVARLRGPQRREALQAFHARRVAIHLEAGEKVSAPTSVAGTRTILRFHERWPAAAGGRPARVGPSGAALAAHDRIRAADLSRPVTFRGLGPGTEVGQWMRLGAGRPGESFCPAGSPPERCGIPATAARRAATLGADPAEAMPREFHRFQVVRWTPALEFTTANTVAHYERRPADRLRSAPGGGTEFYIPKGVQNVRRSPEPSPTAPPAGVKAFQQQQAKIRAWAGTPSPRVRRADLRSVRPPGKK